MKLSQSHILLFIVIIAVACVKDFDLQIDLNQEKILVVDGSLHDNEGPYFVTLSYSYSFVEETPEIIRNGKVWVEDDQGIVYDYFLNGDSIYQSPQELRGEVGKNYTLNVELDGNLYRSESQTLKEAPKIDSIFGQYDIKPNPINDNLIGGFQILFNSEKIKDESIKYFRFEYDDAYLIKPVYPAVWLLELDGNNGVVSIPALSDTVLYPCYKKSKSKELMIATTIKSTDNQIIEYPVKFLPKSQPHLRDRYVIKFKTYVISESAYLYYENIKENNQSEGSLFDRQLGSIFGNMTNVSKPKEPVLGFFEVSGIEEVVKSFVYNRHLPYPRPDYTFTCEEPFYIHVDSLPNYYNANDFKVFVHNIEQRLGDRPLIGITSLECGTCNTFADINPPKFWIK